MKRTLISLVILGLSAFIAISGLNYSREISLLKKSGLNLSRFSVTLVSQNERLMRLGAEGRSMFEFKLPTDYSGLKHCGTGGYSDAKKIDVPELEIRRERGCVYSLKNQEGTLFRYILTDEKIVIIVYV